MCNNIYYVSASLKYTQHVVVCQLLLAPIRSRRGGFTPPANRFRRDKPAPTYCGNLSQADTQLMFLGEILVRK